MTTKESQLVALLHERFENAESIAELRECLRDVEEELHAVFADELSRFVSQEQGEQQEQA
ncbi:hypothetical protein [Ferrimonas marina]|uniref:Uncharacterized protein n=1 Tax=Ferrimonas marina TaxID=299255 RepID=A0A1M5Z4A2_9GAMM|nr:hypothetical protein [Ferrimonas marina]SHI19075.1 hypothetical protein SAMN02745129_4623 [Ferrimonas marina]